MSCEEIWILHIGDATLFQGVMKLIQDVLPHHLVVQLLAPTHIQCEAPHLTADLTSRGRVPIVLGTARYKFRNVSSILQLVCHVPQVVTQRDVCLARLPSIDYGICVEVEGLVTELLQRLIEFESGETGRKGGHEDVTLAVVQLVVLDIREHDFQLIVCADADGIDGQERVGDPVE